MAAWDKFVVTSSGKATINGSIELDILELQNGRKYFLDKDIIANKEILTGLKNYTQEDLKKKDFKYPIYSIIGDDGKETFWIGANIDDPSKLLIVIKEIEDNLQQL